MPNQSEKRPCKPTDIDKRDGRPNLSPYTLESSPAFLHACWKTSLRTVSGATLKV